MIGFLRKREVTFAGLVAFVFSLLLASSLGAQENMGRGRITGSVVDEAGNPLDGVSILVESLSAATKLEGTTDKKGHFALAGLGTGMWRVSAKKNGYSPGSQDLNVKQLSANPPIQFTLKKMTGIAAFLQDKESSALFDKGNELIAQEKYDEAIKIFEDFMVKYPEIYQTHLNIGTCYLKKDEFDKAAAEFQLVLDKLLQTQGSYKKDVQTSIRALSGLGEVALKKGDFDAGQKYFTQALDISPQDEVAAYNVGEIFFSNQKTDEAIKYFEMAIQIKKDWSKPYYKLGVVYLNKGDFAKSLEYLNKFVQMDPDSPEAPQVKSMIAAVEKMKK
jgi:tetratricopeptide (TPR) repeat protein